MDSIVQAQQLYKRFNGVQAVNGVSFEVEKGEIFGFLGPNGAGKTTTVRMLTGVLAPDSGVAWINGKNIQEKPSESKAEIGIAPEVSNAYVDLTAWQNINFMGELYGVPQQERKESAIELLELFGLSDRMNDKVKGYSKGMQRRLILAMAMIHDPPLLFLDEPTAGLDVQSQRLIKRRIRELNEDGKTVFLTTHNIPVANELCDRVAVISRGSIAAIDAPENLKSTMRGTQSVEVGFDGLYSPKDLEKLDKIEKVEKVGDKYRIYGPDPIWITEKLFDLAEEKSLRLISVRTLGPSLEDVFVELTGDE